jgi:hypothetical protein
MTDRPPQVDFGSPAEKPRPLDGLFAERNRLKALIADVESVRPDILRFEREGQAYVTAAVITAAVLMTVDILKVGLSAADRRAAFLFKKFDGGVDLLRSALGRVGVNVGATREDLMKQIATDFAGPARLTQEVRNARAFLKKHGAKETKTTKVLLDLGLVMTEDTLLLLSAASAQADVSRNASAGRAAQGLQLDRMKRQLLLMDAEITRAFEDAQQRSRTA